MVKPLEKKREIPLLAQRLASLYTPPPELRFVLELPTGEKYPHPGELVGSYHRADPETGNVNYELLGLVRCAELS